MKFEETLITQVPIMVRQAQDERDHIATVRPELVEGLVQCFLNPEYRS